MLCTHKRNVCAKVFEAFCRRRATKFDFNLNRPPAKVTQNVKDALQARPDSSDARGGDGSPEPYPLAEQIEQRLAMALAFPDPFYAPPQGPQRRFLPLVARPVLGDLVIPERPICLRSGCAVHA
jgi:hypothetical protein